MSRPSTKTRARRYNPIRLLRGKLITGPDLCATDILMCHTLLDTLVRDKIENLGIDGLFEQLLAMQSAAAAIQAKGIYDLAVSATKEVAKCTDLAANRSLPTLSPSTQQRSIIRKALLTWAVTMPLLELGIYEYAKRNAAKLLAERCQPV